MEQYKNGISIKGYEEKLSSFTKDKAYKYSDVDLYYMTTVESPRTTVFLYDIIDPIEIRSIIVKGAGYLRMDYNDEQYSLLETEPSYFTYSGKPLIVSKDNPSITFVKNSATSEIPVEVDLRDWVIWDINNDMQIINIHSQTFR